MKTRPATSRSMRLFLVALAVLATAALGTIGSGADNRAPVARSMQDGTRQPSVAFNAKGELLRPIGYREWIYVGTPLTPNDMNDGQAAFPEFHSVYINPQAYRHYQRTGEFPDGTVLVKELLSVGTRQASSGKGYFMGEFTGLEVSMKDQTRFKDEPGHWAFFSFGHEYPLRSATRPQAVANCNACHGGLAAGDYVFTQYYPVLRAAKELAKSK